MLQRANLTPAKFEEAVGNDILLTKLQAFISGSATVSENEIHEQFIKQNSKVKFDYAVLKQDDLRKGLHPTDEELKAFYESHKQTLRQLDSREAQGEICGGRDGQGRSRGPGHS